MTMQRRHYALIAETIKGMDFYTDGDNYAHDIRKHVAEEFAFALRRTNERFNPSRFIKACGVGE